MSFNYHTSACSAPTGRAGGAANRMILFTLRCTNGHVFEGWFKDGAAYDRQAEAGVVHCPVCDSPQVAKAPMAPRIAKHGRVDAAPAPVAEAAPAEPAGEGTTVPLADRRMRELLMALRRHVEDTAEHVGERFPEEVRRIHYGETEHRQIYGDASPDEVESLRDEGIEVARIPWLPRTDS